MSAKLRVLLYPLGLIMAGYFIWFFSKSFHAYEIRALLTPPGLASAASASILCALVIPISGWSWSLLLRHQGARCGVAQLVGIMGVTQLAKYVPGNVAQHLGRASLSLGTGIGLRPFMVSIVHEAILAVAASIVVGVGLLIVSPRGMIVVPGAYHFLLWVGLAVAVICIGVLSLSPLWLADKMSSYPGVWRMIEKLGRPPGLVTAFIAFLSYCINYLIIGGGIWLLAYFAVGVSNPSYSSLTASFSLAWFLGFATPGSPAGLGIREGVMTMMLSGTMPDGKLLGLILAARVVTVAGDGLSFVLGFILFRRYGTGVSK